MLPSSNATVALELSKLQNKLRWVCVMSSPVPGIVSMLRFRSVVCKERDR